MYQFYYSKEKNRREAAYDLNVRDQVAVSSIRPTMWEEHCLECSAPACFASCLHYSARLDGRCRRFADGISVSENEKGCCSQSARIRFRKWSNMMTIIFPAMLDEAEYGKLTERNRKLGEVLRKILESRLPVSARWNMVRTIEYLRRRNLRKMSGSSNEPDFFIFHGYSFETSPFRLILEIYNSSQSVFKTSLLLESGENLKIIGREELAPACMTENYLVKIYPENDLEAEVEILWCDFVKGERKYGEEPAAGRRLPKCVVWDLDQTLWDGILIETDDPDQITLRPGIKELMQLLDERGILQSAASKNDFEPAWSLLNKLGAADYLLYPEIHWGPKSGSLDRIAKNLNIGLDTFLFIDDSPFERRQVSDALPQVRTMDAGEMEALKKEVLATGRVTKESRSRRRMYQAENRRQQVREETGQDLIDFLRRSHIHICIIDNPDRENLDRCYELTVRTNQLNMTGIKYSREQFDTVVQKPGHRIFALQCEDDFGSYGIVGFGQYTVRNDELYFTEYAMSCRVAGKYIENALFGELLKRNACERGRFRIQKTQKNILLRNTLEGIGFAAIYEDKKQVEYLFEKDLPCCDVVTIRQEI